MTLSIKISHNNPGYPVRALVSVRNAAGEEAYAGRTPVGDREDKTFLVHAGQWLKITEEGHQRPDLAPIAKRAYAAYRGRYAHPQLVPEWDDLEPTTQDAWLAVAEVFE
jgi:hypothetical protein